MNEEAQAQTELARQVEADELDAAASEAAPETCDPVADRSSEFAAETYGDPQEIQDVDFEELSAEDRTLVLRDVLGQALQQNGVLEARLTNVEGILYRILEAAEKAEVKSRIEVPTMAIPGKHAKFPTRNSR